MPLEKFFLFWGSGQSLDFGVHRVARGGKLTLCHANRGWNLKMPYTGLNMLTHCNGHAGYANVCFDAEGSASQRVRQIGSTTVNTLSQYSPGVEESAWPRRTLAFHEAKSARPWSAGIGDHNLLWRNA